MTPKWLIEPKDLRIKSGNNIAIDCKADGEPKPIIKWIDMKGVKTRLKSTSLKSFTEFQLFRKYY